MDKVKGVVTGDVVRSSVMHGAFRDALLASLRLVASDLSLIEPVSVEIFRGDSFQLVVDAPENALRIAILLRIGLKSHTPHDSPFPWDARLSVGIGSISYHADSVVLSDGEAFQFSGRELDKMGKRRLVLKTRWQDVNDELTVSTAFADDVISSWSVAQSQAAYQSILYAMPQKDIALKLHMSAQNVSKLLSTARLSLINAFINRYHALISSHAAL